ncbi:unnamed protein product, partial [Polarella glacialis]
WDRTPAGPAQRLSIDTWQPRVRVSCQVADELARCAEAIRLRSSKIQDNARQAPWTLADSRRITLVGSCSCSGAVGSGSGSSSQMSLSIDRVLFDADASSSEMIARLGAGGVAIPIHVLPAERHVDRGQRGHDVGSMLAPATAQQLLIMLESAGSAEERAAKASSEPLSPEVFLSWAGVLSADLAGGPLELGLGMLYPRWCFHAVALARPLRTLDSPLLRGLLSGAHFPGFGFLTLDLGRRVVCLRETDDLVEQTPIVGVWLDLSNEDTSGERGVLDLPSLWAAAARYIHHRRVGERVWVEDSTFLLMAVHSDMSSTRGLSFFELRYECTGDFGAYIGSGSHSLGSSVRAGDISDGPWIQVPMCPAELRDIRLAATPAQAENPEVDIPLDDRSTAAHKPRPWPESHGREALHHLQDGVGSTASRSTFDFSPRLSLNFRMEQPRDRPPEPHPGLQSRSYRPASLVSKGSQPPGPLQATAPHVADSLDTNLDLCRSDDTFLSGLHSSSRIEAVRDRSLGMRQEVATEQRLKDSWGAQPADHLAGFLPPFKGKGLAGIGLQPSAPSTVRSSLDQASLLRLVGSQQSQLTDMQQQLSNMHLLISTLVGSGQGAVLPDSGSSPAHEVGRSEHEQETDIAGSATKKSADASHESANSVQTSCPPAAFGEPNLSVVSAGLRAAPLLCDAGVNVGDSLVLSWQASQANTADSHGPQDLLPSTAQLSRIAATIAAGSGGQHFKSSTSQDDGPEVLGGHLGRLPAIAAVSQQEQEQQQPRYESLEQLRPAHEPMQQQQQVGQSVQQHHQLHLPVGCQDRSGPDACEDARPTFLSSSEDSLDSESWRLVVPSMPSQVAAGLAAAAAAGAPLKAALLMGSLRDSADTAGGATPRRPPAASPTAGRTPDQVRISDQPQWNQIMAGVPRIICPSSPSVSGSDDSLDDLALSDAGSMDMLGDALGLAYR